MKRVKTTCPSCATSFYVSPSQLGSGQGHVRCGKCDHVFNALESIELDADQAAREAAAGAPSEAGATAAHEAATPRAMAAAVAAATLTRTAPPLSAAGDVLEKPPLVLTDRVEGPWWRIGVALLALLLALQIALFYRSELARDYPGARPLLEAVCGLFGCRVALWKDLSQVTIEASDLQIDPAREGEITLIASVRNRARFVQAHPSLELTLTDARDQPIARKVLNPGDYLANPADAAQGMPANAELGVRLKLGVGALRAVGYRLLLFYP